MYSTYIVRFPDPSSRDSFRRSLAANPAYCDLSIDYLESVPVAIIHHLTPDDVLNLERLAATGTRFREEIEYAPAGN